MIDAVESRKMNDPAEISAGSFFYQLVFQRDAADSGFFISLEHGDPMIQGRKDSFKIFFRGFRTAGQVNDQASIADPGCSS